MPILHWERMMTIEITTVVPGPERATTRAKTEGTTATSAKRRIRKAPPEQPDGATGSAPATVAIVGTNKLDQLAALLANPAGASIAAMMAATGWQAHSVRGALAGALKKRGLTITSDKVDGVRIYRAGTAT